MVKRKGTEVTLNVARLFQSFEQTADLLGFLSTAVPGVYRENIAVNRVEEKAPMLLRGQRRLS